jgi:hypothetical protein
MAGTIALPHMSAWTDADNDVTNLSGGPDLDTMRKESPDVVDSDDTARENPRLADERSGAPFPTSDPAPSGDDPFVAGGPEVTGGLQDPGPEMPGLDPSGEDGPTYEKDQGPVDDESGGSTDPHNSMIHGQRELKE